METPVSVQVVPKQVLQDQRVNRLQEAIENVSGVRSKNDDVDGIAFTIRGFESLNILRNGLSLTGGRGSQPTVYETANLERVEVLKGPASVLFGRISPGGLINLVPKRPLSQPYYKVEQEFGSFNHYRTVWDATGPLTESGAVGYRMTGSYQDYDSFRDFQGGRRLFIAPSVSFKLSRNTDLVVDFQYQRNSAQSDTGFPALGSGPAPIPLRRSFQEPNDRLDFTGSLNLGYDLTHRFTDHWSITSRFLYTNGTMQRRNIVATALDEAAGILDRTAQFQKLIGSTYSTNLDLNGRFETMGILHRVLVGGDYLHDYYNYQFSQGGGNFPINIFNPLYGSIPESAFDDAASGTGGFNFFSTVRVRQAGVYWQDQLTLFNRLHVLLGGRYDDAEVRTGESDVSPAAASADRRTRPEESDSQFSPRAGLLYQLTPAVSVYASYSKSFYVNNGRSALGNPLPPQRGIQYEIGLKTELSSRLTATLALFHLTNKNVLTADLSTPDPTDSAAIGESRSRGIEFDIVGKVTSRLNVIAHYAYLDTEVTKDNSGLEGNRLINAPRHSGRLFAVYHLGGDDGLGWRVGGGVTVASKTVGDPENTFDLPAYTRLDALASYTMTVGGKLLTAQLNLRNLTNVQYFNGADTFYNAGPRFGLYPAPPFTAIGTIRLEF
ncbi:MAG TPA: TonB-dependent siderophore receptor [Nitrospira sp.]|nr:TonB-dependent siderophore receptor [Nitrospira sp.]